MEAERTVREEATQLEDPNHKAALAQDQARKIKNMVVQSRLILAAYGDAAEKFRYAEYKRAARAAQKEQKA